MNPLLDLAGLPRFAEIRPAHVAPALEQVLGEARAAIGQLGAAAASWETFVAPLEDANERVTRVWGVVAHLHAVADSPALREAYNAGLPRVTQYWTGLAHDARLYAGYKSLAASDGFGALPPARRRVVENALRDFRLGGAELAPEAKQRFAALEEELARHAAAFSEHLLDATNAFALNVEDERRLAGLPPDALHAAAARAAEDGRRGWTFTLHAPSYLPVLRHADDRALRETLYRESVTRASEFGPPERDNTPLMRRILELRGEQAALLGYPNYAELSLVPKMAGSAGEVTAFLEDLARRARPFAEREAAELREFARTELGLAALEAWDVAWAAEKLRARRFAFSEQEVRQYFPEDAVQAGLFRLAGALYGVRAAPVDAPAWHAEVRCHELRDAAGERLGLFYTDLHARATKRGGAWMDEAIARRRRNGTLQAPVAYLCCNFSGPVGGRPALLGHDEVLTLFHESGHGLHHLLTRMEDLGVSGISGVEWDAVELPSQFMENFAWEYEVLEGMTRHAATGAPLPRELHAKMLAAKNFHGGLATLRQIEYALFDMRLHAGFDPRGAPGVLDVLEAVRDEVAVLRPPAWNRFPNNFSHVFAGGYAAGYYSYKWAEVLSADAYSAFEERRDAGGIILDPATGARFRDEILAVGGSRPAAESFRAFRGRAPRVEALLRHSGMMPPSQQ